MILLARSHWKSGEGTWQCRSQFKAPLSPINVGRGVGDTMHEVVMQEGCTASTLHGAGDFI